MIASTVLWHLKAAFHRETSVLTSCFNADNTQCKQLAHWQTVFEYCSVITISNNQLFISYVLPKCKNYNNNLCNLSICGTRVMLAVK